MGLSMAEQDFQEYEFSSEFMEEKQRPNVALRLLAVVAAVMFSGAFWYGLACIVKHALITWGAP